MKFLQFQSPIPGGVLQRDCCERKLYWDVPSPKQLSLPLKIGRNPKRKGSEPSNHQFSGAFAVSFREGNCVRYTPTGLFGTESAIPFELREIAVLIVINDRSWTKRTCADRVNMANFVPLSESQSFDQERASEQMVHGLLANYIR